MLLLQNFDAIAASLFDMQQKQAIADAEKYSRKRSADELPAVQDREKKLKTELDEITKKQLAAASTEPSAPVDLHNEMNAFMLAARLPQYAADMNQDGYDDVPSLCKMSDAQVNDMAQELATPMKKGHLVRLKQALDDRRVVTGVRQGGV